MPRSAAASTSRKTSSRPRWPVQRTRSLRATTSSTASASGRSAARSSTTGTGSQARPVSRSDSSNSTQTGTFAWAPGRSTSSCSFTEETVGNQTIRAPWRAATSTASGLRPPTARLSVIVPSTVTPGTAAATTCARSVVGA